MASFYILLLLLLIFTAICEQCNLINGEVNMQIALAVNGSGVVVVRWLQSLRTFVEAAAGCWHCYCCSFNMLSVVVAAVVCCSCRLWCYFCSWLSFFSHFSFSHLIIAVVVVKSVLPYLPLLLMTDDAVCPNGCVADHVVDNRRYAFHILCKYWYSQCMQQVFKQTYSSRLAYTLTHTHASIGIYAQSCI